LRRFLRRFRDGRWSVCGPSKLVSLFYPRRSVFPNAYVPVLLQYQGTLANLPKALEPTLERSTTFITMYQPESDLTALIERYRTGPFRPVPQLYESVAHDESDVVFGIDLRKWAEGGWSALTSGEEKKDLVPPVLTALLDALDAAYPKLPSDTGAWLFLVCV